MYGADSALYGNSNNDNNATQQQNGFGFPGFGNSKSFLKNRTCSIFHKFFIEFLGYHLKKKDNALAQQLAQQRTTPGLQSSQQSVQTASLFRSQPQQLPGVQESLHYGNPIQRGTSINGQRKENN